MRSTIIGQNDVEIIKCVNGLQEVCLVIKNTIVDYGNWLASVGLSVAETSVDYRSGKIYFYQPFIDSKRSDSGLIIRAILKLEFGRFGIDASPDNFLGDGILVDLYPFLVDKQDILEAQFSYPYSEIKGRYFDRLSVLATYLIRLYKVDPRGSLSFLSDYRELLRDGIERGEILPRECLRLLKMISLGGESGGVFEDFYVRTKGIHTFSEKDKKRLLVLLTGALGEK